MPGRFGSPGPYVMRCRPRHSSPRWINAHVPLRRRSAGAGGVARHPGRGAASAPGPAPGSRGHGAGREGRRADSAPKEEKPADEKTEEENKADNFFKPGDYKFQIGGSAAAQLQQWRRQSGNREPAFGPGGRCKIRFCISVAHTPGGGRNRRPGYSSILPECIAHNVICQSARIFVAIAPPRFYSSSMGAAAVVPRCPAVPEVQRRIVAP